MSLKGKADLHLHARLQYGKSVFRWSDPKGAYARSRDEAERSRNTLLQTLEMEFLPEEFFNFSALAGIQTMGSWSAYTINDSAFITNEDKNIYRYAVFGPQINANQELLDWLWIRASMGALIQLRVHSEGNILHPNHKELLPLDQSTLRPVLIVLAPSLQGIAQLSSELALTLGAHYQQGITSAMKAEWGVKEWHGHWGGDLGIRVSF